MNLSNFLQRIVPITLFNKGQASKLFHRVEKEGALAVVKNNQPVAIILSPEEYCLLQSIVSICREDIATNGHIISTERIRLSLENIEKLDQRGDTGDINV